MKGIIGFSILVIVSSVVLKMCTTEIIIGEGVAEVCDTKLKKTMWKVGPMYDYKIDNGKLYVKKGDKWLRVQY